MIRTIYVSDLGGVWKIPRKLFDILLDDIRCGNTIDLDSYGVMITPKLLSLNDLIERHSQRRNT